MDGNTTHSRRQAVLFCVVYLFVLLSYPQQITLEVSTSLQWWLEHLVDICPSGQVAILFYLLKVQK